MPSTAYRSARDGAARFRRLAGAAALAALVAGCGESTGPGSGELPQLTALEPTLVFVGDTQASVTLRGTGFGSGSRVRLDGQDRTTTYVSSTELTLSLDADDLAEGGTVQVTVSNPGAGTSGSQELTIGFPMPTATSLTPTSVSIGAPATTVRIFGTGFRAAGTRVSFAGANLTPVIVSETELTVEAGPGTFQAAGYKSVRVTNPSPAGGTSEPLEFGVEYPVPVLTSASPEVVVAGVDSRLMLAGGYFGSETSVVWDGVEYTPSIVSPTHAYVDLPGSAFDTPETGSLTTLHPEPGGGASTPVEITVVPPPPVITGFSPASAEAGSGAFTLTIEGDHFTTESVASWDGAALATTFVDASRVDIEVSAADVSTSGAGMILVSDPTNGASPLVGFPITHPSPTVTASASTTLRVQGLVADPHRDVVYVSLGALEPLYTNEIVALDPYTGDVLWNTPAGSDPTRLAISEDGAYLFVALAGAASISRIDLETRLKDLDLTLPTGQRAEDMVAIPGSSGSVAASLRNTCCSPRHEGVVVFDGDVQRPVSTQGHTGSNRLERGPHGERLYGYTNESSGFGFRRLIVGESGLIEDGVVGGVISGFGVDIAYDGGLIFSTSGHVLDPETRVLRGTIPASGHVRPDVENGRVHFLSEGSIEAFHYSSFSSLGSISVPQRSGGTDFVRFGDDGLAFWGADEVHFIRSPLIG